jgi:hypothetical protein
MATRAGIVRACCMVVLLSVAACTAQPTSPGDGAAGSGDPADLGPGDAAAPGGGNDLSATVPDLATPTPPDLATPADLAMGPPDLAIAGGLTWPPSQAFPSFAPIGALDVIDLNPLANDRRTLMVTLAGLINRTRPRIYTTDDGGEGKTFWLDKVGATSTTMFSDPFALVTKYRAEFKGIVIYDDAQADTINLATTIAGQRDGIVASPAVAAILTAAPYQLPVLDDLRVNHFANKLAVYQYELDHYSAAATHRLIIGLNPGIAAFVRDYAVATQAMTVWLDPRVPAESQLLNKFFALLPPNSPYLGWWLDEPSGVHAAATFGIPVYAADFSSNLTVLGGTPRGSAAVPPPPAPPTLENKVYVAIFMSDGDNLQEDQHLVPMKWNSGHRGEVPIGWTIDPALVDVAPVILRYFQETATLNDVLVSGPSGLGYTYPAAWPSGAFVDYAKLTASYVKAARLRVVTVWNNGVDLADNDARAYLQQMPDLVGLTIQDESRALRFIDDKLPIMRLNISYGDTEAILEGGIDAQVKSWNGSAPLFVAVQGNMNMGTISPGAFAAVQGHYTNNTNVAFVRADHFFQLVNVANHLPQHRVFGGDFNGDGKSDALMYYAGDSNWWMALSDGTKLTWHGAGNSAAAGNLTDGKHIIDTGDYTGDHKADVLTYGVGDGTWRLGVSDGNALTWKDAGNTNNFGKLLDGKHRVFHGDFDGDGKRDALFYYSTDGNWWMGLSDGTKLTWHGAGNTSGFGNLLDGSHLFQEGDYNGDGKADLMFFSSDGTWWLGLSDGNKLTWTNAGSTSGFGNLVEGSHRVVSGDFNGDGKTDALFYYNGDGNWWLGLSDGTKLTWKLAGNTPPPRNLIDWNHRLFVADYTGDGKSDAMFYDAAAGGWWLGVSDGNKLTFAPAGSTAGLGNLVDPSRLLLGGDYNGDGKADGLFYYNGDGNWWLGLSDATKLTWQLAGNSSGFGDLTR